MKIFGSLIIGVALWLYAVGVANADEYLDKVEQGAIEAVMIIADRCDLISDTTYTRKIIVLKAKENYFKDLGLGYTPEEAAIMSNIIQAKTARTFKCRKY